VSFPWTQRPSLSIREVARLTGDSVRGVEEKIAAGRLRGPQHGLVWPRTVLAVYGDPESARSALSTPQKRLSGRLLRLADSLTRTEQSA
jgi:hypothetical protein